MNELIKSESDILQERAIAQIQPLIPPDSEKRVRQAVTRFNKAVREQLRLETGLRIKEEGTKIGVKIRVVQGFPTPLARLINAYQDATLWMLILALPKLEFTAEGLGTLVENWKDFETWLELPHAARGGKPALERSIEVVKALLKLEIAKKVFADLKQINEDLLGVYRFDIFGAQIEIYWMPIALFAGAFGVQIDDLVVVVLAHELAHAYTQMGHDIDGNYWSFNGFKKSDLEVVEGLAQFYTNIVAQRLSIRVPGAYRAYEKLLENQSGPYIVHTKWFNYAYGQHSEIVRFALLRARAKDEVRYQEWLDLLEETKKTLRSYL